MKILYTPAGDTDPIRNFRDGGILHIIRHYGIDLAVIFLSADMSDKENERQIYSRAIKYVAPECKVNFIKTGIKDAHHMESLLSLADEFIYCRRRYPDAEFFLNLSSGTPQMKTIMAFLANDFSDVRAIQVDSPMKGSNRGNPAVRDINDIETMIELNEDNAPEAENRCREAPLELIRRYGLRQQIISLVKNYEYGGAWAVYEKHKALFAEETGRYLQHARLRQALMTGEAFKFVKNDIKQKREVQALNEFLMVMELCQRQGKLPDFIIKLTPFLYELTLFHLTSRFNVKLDKICSTEGKNKGQKISISKLQQNYPRLLSALREKWPDFRDGTELSFANILVMLHELSEDEAELLEVLDILSDSVSEHRNKVAHEITNITEDVLRNTKPRLSSKEILQRLREAFFLVMEKEEIHKGNVYDSLNQKIIASMDNFGKSAPRQAQS